MNNVKATTIFVMASIAAMLSMLLYMAVPAMAANPNAANNITVMSSGARTDGTSGFAVDALAGNVTLLRINDTRTTLRWQGYYGNITGAITLQDGSGNILYDWSIASPQGEIFASNTSTVAWSNITCFNISEYNTSKQRVNTSILENSYGMSVNDQDGINETFSTSFGGSFSVGSKTITSTSGCSMLYTYVNSGAQSTRFQEVLLTDNSTTNVVYTTILERDQTGFTGSTFDFQMIVGENGDASGTSTYYFFVELN